MLGFAGTMNIISVIKKSSLCIQAMMCATNGGATARSLDNRASGEIVSCANGGELDNQ